MSEFFEAINVERKLRNSLEPYLDRLEKKNLEELIVHDKRNDWYICPICRKKITTFVRFIKHFRWLQNRWELIRLHRIKEKAPQGFENQQIDFIYKDELKLNKKLYRKLWLYVVACKILERLNPKQFLKMYQKDDFIKR